MAVRVKIRVHASKAKHVDVVAVANAGAETDVPILAIPPEIAQELSLWPSTSY